MMYRSYPVADERRCKREIKADHLVVQVWAEKTAAFPVKGERRLVKKIRPPNQSLFSYLWPVMGRCLQPRPAVGPLYGGKGKDKTRYPGGGRRGMVG
ncbi:MAG: hypothetical protein D6750_08580 [Bacteroidetes bacterium]|nr:MAG: hypothetical protein D6750_08580 [Bacteroidota bacterium]